MLHARDPPSTLSCCQVQGGIATHTWLCAFTVKLISTFPKIKNQRKNPGKTKKFHVACGFALTISKSKTKTKAKRTAGEKKKKEMMKMTHAHKSCAEKCSQMLPFVTRESHLQQQHRLLPPLGQGVACRDEASLIASWGLARKPLIKMRFLSPAPRAAPTLPLHCPHSPTPLPPSSLLYHISCAFEYMKFIFELLTSFAFASPPLPPYILPYPFSFALKAP